MNEENIKHLEMIEGAVERMASNSFQLKGWAVTLVALIGGLASKGSDRRFLLLAFIPLIAFWFLDAYYLQLERKYRVLYQNVVDHKISNFCMDLQKIRYIGDEADRVCYCRCFWAKTEAAFYFTIIVAVSLLTVILVLK